MSFLRSIDALAVQQVTPTAGGPLALVGTFVLLSLLFALTAHVAARYVLGDVPYSRALFVGPVPAAVTLLLQQYPTWAMILVGVIGDFLAIRFVYRVRAAVGALVTVVHYAVTVILSLIVFFLIVTLSTAPL
ncbi:hypothetical protein ACFQPA_10725 [Halomarina halobia]|uniref:Yip1 domain-containing protein n=1 Tax=Halomarina halobia TaxID=3033386 RepID=A0ABD6AA61_9EURY|nr:hypothetical protein [Halomarina sp. PSR21]